MALLGPRDPGVRCGALRCEAGRRMLRFSWMAMQQSSKGASGTGPNPALSDDQADQFAASFTPAWDADDGLGDATHGTAAATAAFAPDRTQIMDRPELAKTQEMRTEPAAPPIVGTPAIIYNAKSTMIGVPPPATLTGRPAAGSPVSVPPPAPGVRAPAASAEMIDPENVLEVVAAPAAALVAHGAAPVHQNRAMSTQIMQSRPAPGVFPASPHGAATIGSRPANQRSAAAVPIVDPFRNRNPSSDELEAFPKRSNKTVLFIVAGLAVAAGLGVFLKFALGDDPPKPATAEVVTGPALTTAEIPPPPPKDDTAAATTAKVATAAKTAEPAPPPLATPPRAAIDPPVAASPPPRAAVATPPAARSEPRPPRGATLPSPPAAAAPPPAAAAQPKSAPKASNGGIVRDNPF